MIKGSDELGGEKHDKLCSKFFAHYLDFLTCQVDL